MKTRKFYNITIKEKYESYKSILTFSFIILLYNIIRIKRKSNKKQSERIGNYHENRFLWSHTGT